MHVSERLCGGFGIPNKNVSMQEGRCHHDVSKGMQKISRRSALAVTASANSTYDR
jgi:hypothetical protein